MIGSPQASSFRRLLSRQRGMTAHTPFAVANILSRLYLLEQFPGRPIARPRRRFEGSNPSCRCRQYNYFDPHDEARPDSQ